MLSASTISARVVSGRVSVAWMPMTLGNTPSRTSGASTGVSALVEPASTLTVVYNAPAAGAALSAERVPARR